MHLLCQFRGVTSVTKSPCQRVYCSRIKSIVFNYSSNISWGRYNILIHVILTRFKQRSFIGLRPFFVFLTTLVTDYNEGKEEDQKNRMATVDSGHV